jgi:crotonobetainyl-CoA:carnitine CoA-transferase CaiB-like acyl-CoA transferase
MNEVRQRNGSRATYTAPSNVYRCADGQWVTIVGTGDGIFARICRAMDRTDLLQDPRFSDNLQRVKHLQALDQAVADWCAQHPSGHIMAALDAQQAPYSRVNSVDQAMADPHFQSRQAVIDLPDAELGSVPAPCIVPRLPGRTLPVPATGPSKGEHNARIYGQLGLSEQELEQLRREGCI